WALRGFSWLRHYRAGDGGGIDPRWARRRVSAARHRGPGAVLLPSAICADRLPHRRRRASDRAAVGRYPGVQANRVTRRAYLEPLRRYAWGATPNSARNDRLKLEMSPNPASSATSMTLVVSR